MNRILLPAVFLVAILYLPSFTSAATLYIDPATAELYRGDALTAAIRIMPDQTTGECINTVDAVISYSGNIQPIDVSVGRSIFNLWVERPTINKEKKTITLAGGVTNGYCGRVEGDPRLTNVVAEIIFRSPGMVVGGGSEDNLAIISFAPETQVLLNDGLGTRAELITLGSTITLLDGAGPGITDAWRDNVRADTLPPEEFSITLTKDDITFNGRYYIVFNTSDKQTGLSHFEVTEESLSEQGLFKWGGVGVPWLRVDANTYELKDQSLKSVVRVKAIDKAGNEYIATLIPDESLQTVSTNNLSTWAALAGLGFLMVIVLAAGIFLIIRRRRTAKEDVLNVIESNE